MNLFKPIMVVVNNAIVVINQFAKAVGDSLGKILGWRYEVGNGAVALEDTADYMDDVGSSAGGASKAAKELKRQLQGFDELNLLTTDPDNGRGGGGGGGGGLGGSGGASNLAGQWVKDEGLFESDWDTWFKLGRGISDAWTQGLNSIDWDEVYQNFSDFGTGLAQFLNGLITPDLFGALGRTIAGALNSAIYATLSFSDTLDWKQMGDSLASAITNFFDTFDFSSAGKAMHSLQSGVLTMLITAIDNVDWYKVGESIGTFLENLDIPDLLAKLGELATKIAGGLYDALCGLWDNTTWQTKFGLAILGFLKLAKLTGLGGILSSTIGGQMPGSISIPKVLGIAISVAFSFQAGSKIGSTIGALVAEYIMDDPGLADEYINYGNMTIGEKFNYYKDSFAGWDKSDTDALFANRSTKLERILEYAENGEVYNGILSEFSKANMDLRKELDKLPPAFKKTFLKSLNEQSSFHKSYTSNLEEWLKGNQKAVEDSHTETEGGWKDFYEILQEITGSGNSNVTSSTDKMKQNVTSKYSEMVTKAKSGVSDMMNHSITSFITLKDSASTNTTTMKDTVATNTTSMKNTIVSNSNTSKNTFIQNLTSMKQENDKQTSSIYQTTSKWSENLKKLVSGTKANATFGVTTTSQDVVKRAYDGLKSVWTNHSANYTINAENNPWGIRGVWDTNASMWTDKQSSFTVFAENSAGHVRDVWNEMASQWQDKNATYNLDITTSVAGAAAGGAIGVAKETFNAWIAKTEEKLKSKMGDKFALPRLATGAVVDQATLAMIGEAGAEAVVPLENNTGWLGKMADMLTTEMSYSAPSYTSGSYTANTSGARSEQDIAEQNALLREQNRLLQIIANKDVTISSSDVFNATMDEGENYYHKTGNSPFIF